MADAEDAIATAVAQAKGVDRSDLDVTLGDHVSLGAIEMLLAHDGGPWELSFGLPGHVVKVMSTGAVYVDGDRYEQVPRASN
jgi:hypothetical protein